MSNGTRIPLSVNRLKDAIVKEMNNYIGGNQYNKEEMKRWAGAIAKAFVDELGKTKVECSGTSEGRPISVTGGIVLEVGQNE